MRVARHAGGIEVGALVACGTPRAYRTEAIGAALDRRLM
jgi:hypothetical protein